MTNIKRLHPDFYLEADLYQGLSDTATDWYIKSWKFKTNSLEWQICRLKMQLANRRALKHLGKALKYLNG